MWPWKKRQDGEAGLPGLYEGLSELRADFKELRRDVDDLDESFRRFRGRRSKVEALERDEGTEAPELLAPGPVASASVHSLKQHGKWPFAK